MYSNKVLACTLSVIDDRSALTMENKVVSLDILVKIREHLKEKGTRVVFTNGCFDILHAGHVAYLEEAKGLGDVLMVGLNSDDSVRRLKGAGRPIMPEAERATVLAGLEAVDYVCLFKEDTAHALIEALVPDVLVKGGNYRMDEIVEGEAALRRGIEVYALKEVTGASTTALIDQIVARFGGKTD